MNTSERFAKNSMIFLVSLFVILSVWFVLLIVGGHGADSQSAQIWSSVYQILAWVGALSGLYFAKLWGGTKSLLGKSNIAFALGLLAQSFGQSVFSYYFYSGVEAPYPSLADVGFFGSIPIYIYAIYTLAQVSGAKLSSKLFTGRVQILLVPVLILSLTYYFFLREYQADFSQPLLLFLDFGYPFGQAIYISIAILAYLLTKNYLGGMMKTPVIFFILALFVQFVADFTFLYQISLDTYDGGLEIDYLYLLAYFVMGISLIKLGSTYYKIQKS